MIASVGTEGFWFEMRMFAIEMAYMFFSFMGKLLASPGVVVYLTDYPEQFSGTLFPWLFYVMNWVDYGEYPDYTEV